MPPILVAFISTCCFPTTLPAVIAGLSKAFSLLGPNVANSDMKNRFAHSQLYATVKQRKKPYDKQASIDKMHYYNKEVSHIANIYYPSLLKRASCCLYIIYYLQTLQKIAECTGTALEKHQQR